MTTQRAVLAGGCFWGIQDLIRKLPGVVSTRVGYSGGKLPNATYRNRGNHAEAIEIVFDSARTDFRALLEFFFQFHDPTTVNRQGNDRGASYRSAIFYTDHVQKVIAEDTIADVEASGVWPGKVVTELSQQEISGRPSQNTRIISNADPRVTRVTLSGQSGNWHGVRPLPGARSPRPDCRPTRASLNAAARPITRHSRPEADFPTSAIRSSRQGCGAGRVPG